MKKRILTILMCGVLAMTTLAACGSSEESAAPAAPATENVTEEPAGTESATNAENSEAPAATDDAVTDETWANLQSIYQALVDAHDATAAFYNDDSVAPSEEIETAMAEAADLIVQVGEIDRSTVTEADAADIVDAMLAINEIFEAVLETAQPAEAALTAEDIAAYFQTTYAGITEDENTYAYVAFGEEIGALMFYDTSTNASGSFLGAFELDEENNLVTITDQDNGLAISFQVTETENGFLLDMGDEGAAYVEPVDALDFGEAFIAISEGSEPQF